MRSSKTNLSEGSTCKIRLLDDTELSYEIKRDIRGIVLVDFVCSQLDLLEKDYFGLRYVDTNKQRHWLDPSKEIYKQLKECRPPYMFFFRVKFYPTDPTKLKEEITRYQLYLQLKRDILHGRLLCPFNNITDLAAHVVQAELGDYDDEEHSNIYLNGIKLLPRQNEKLEEKIMEYHKTLNGYTPSEAERRFLNLARSQDLYGVDPHPCKDQEDLPLYLGLTPQGIQIIREARRVSGFVWADIGKVSYENKLFYIQVNSEKKKKNYAFRLNDSPACKHLWKCAVEHMSFYSEEPIKTQVPRRSALSPQNIFKRSKYKYSGKTEVDLRNDSEKIRRSEPPLFKRTSSLRLSVISNRKSCISMPDLEDIQTKFRKQDNNSESETKSDQKNKDETRSKAESNEGSNSGKEDDLAEFETEEFPKDSKRSSLNLDNVSTSSSQDASSSHLSSNDPQPLIHIENVDGGEIDNTTSSPNEKSSITDEEEKPVTPSPKFKEEQKSGDSNHSPPMKLLKPMNDLNDNKHSTQNVMVAKFNRLYNENPMVVLFFIVFSIIPVAMVVHGFLS